MDGPGIRRAALRLAVPLAAMTLLVAACTGSRKPASVAETTAAPAASPVRTVPPPATPAGAQLRWLTAELARLPMSDAQVRAHFDAAFLAQVSRPR